jgi:hypothetical protein
MKATTGTRLDITMYKDAVPSIAVLLTIGICMVCAAFVVDAEATPAVASAMQIADAD